MQEINTFLSRKSFIKKDGRRQLIILIKIGIRNKTFTETERFEIPIIINSKNFCVNEEEYNNLVTNKVKETRLIIFELEKHLKSIVKNFLVSKTHITSQLLIKQLYNQIELSKKEQNFIKTNTFLYEKYNKKLTRKEYDEFDNVLNDISKSKGFVEDDDIEIALTEALTKDFSQKERDKIKNMSLDQRYNTNNFDKGNILHLLGFCWSINPNNGCSYVSTPYKTIIFHIADFIYNSEKHPTANTRKVDFNWINDFLVFKKDFGFPILKLSNYTPFNIHEYYDKFKNSEREQLSLSTFQKIVKQIKFYIKILQSKGFLKNIDYNLINSNAYISRKNAKVTYTRAEHSLWPEELMALKNTDFNSDELNLARDMYLIQTFAGGLRNGEMYGPHFKVVGDNFEIIRYKTKKVSTNPIMDEIKDIIQKYDGLPNFLSQTKYRAALTAIAKQMQLDRRITSYNTKIDAVDDIISIPISKILKPYTARKTFVLYMYILGLTKKQIMEYTGHDDEKSLLSYIDRLPIQYKRELIQSKEEMKKLNKQFE
jgi:hypothetical protein